MAIVVPTQSLSEILTDLISTDLNGCVIRLYTVNITPGPTTTLASLLAAEASFPGYTPFTINDWSTPTINTSNDAQTSTGSPAWTPTAAGGTGNLYGYFLTNAAGTKWYGAELFTGAPLSSAQSVPFNVDVTYTAGSAA